jgi:sugar lactone lactonase YvrE
MPIGNAFTILKSVKVKVPMVETFININQPEAMVFDSSGNLFVTCSGGSWINKITPTGVMTTFTQIITATRSIRPLFLGIDSSNNIYTTDPTTQGSAIYNFNIYKIDTLGQLSTFYKNLGNSSGIVIDKSDNIFVSDYFQINKFNLSGTRTSNFGKTNTLQAAPTIQAVALDNNENVYFSDSKNKVTYKIKKDGSSWTQYGGGFTNPNSICLDKYDNLYVVDGNIIKKFYPGSLSNFAGTATAGDSIGAASLSKFNNIRNILYKNDFIYIADKNNNKIKKLIL